MVLGMRSFQPVRAPIEPRTVALRLGASRDKSPIVVGLVSSALSIASTAYYYRQNLIFGHTDSFAHLELSRRVVTGLSPGIVQLGGVWLPLPQLLQAMFSWNFTLYKTGLAGAIVSMACYVSATVFVYLTIRMLANGRMWPAIAGTVVLAANVNILYQQSTPLDELPFIAFTSAAVYYLVRWGQMRDARNILFSSVASMLAMLCRYEAWYLACVYIVCILVMGWRLHYSWRDIRGLALVQVFIGFIIPATGWLTYNYLIFGSPLNFAEGKGSSSTFIAQYGGGIKYIGKWPLTIKTYAVMIASDFGLAVVGVALVGLLVLLIGERLSAPSVPVVGLVTIIPFFIFTLEQGGEPMSMPSQTSLLNYRFGLIVALPAALLTGYLVSKIPGRAMIGGAMVVTLALTGLSVQAFRGHRVALAIEAAQERLAAGQELAAGAFLTHHTNGLILADTGNVSAIFNVVDRCVYDGTREAGRNQWSRVLRDPPAFGIRVILMRLPIPGQPTDTVYTALFKTRLLKDDYRRVYSNQTYAIYDLRTGIHVGTLNDPARNAPVG